jgi:hypothetical protein
VGLFFASDVQQDRFNVFIASQDSHLLIEFDGIEFGLDDCPKYFFVDVRFPYLDQPDGHLR